MTICFGRFDSEISDLKKTHTSIDLVTVGGSRTFGVEVAATKYCIVYTFTLTIAVFKESSNWNRHSPNFGSFLLVFKAIFKSSQYPIFLLYEIALSIFLTIRQIAYVPPYLIEGRVKYVFYPPPLLSDQRYWTSMNIFVKILNFYKLFRRNPVFWSELS